MTKCPLSNLRLKNHFQKPKNFDRITFLPDLILTFWWNLMLLHFWNQYKILYFLPNIIRLKKSFANPTLHDVLYCISTLKITITTMQNSTVSVATPVMEKACREYTYCTYWIQQMSSKQKSTQSTSETKSTADITNTLEIIRYTTSHQTNQKPQTQQTKTRQEPQVHQRTRTLHQKQKHIRKTSKAETKST